MPISNNLPPISPLPAPTGGQSSAVKPVIPRKRSGQTTPNSDTFQASLKTTIEQAKAFLAGSTGTEPPKALEAHFLASVLSPYLQTNKNRDGTPKPDEQAFAAFKTMNEKLVSYLQADDLHGAFTLLNGTHAPIENEFTGKYNPLKWLQNKMLTYVQEQPQYPVLSPELASFEAFEGHLNTLRQQFQLCLGAVETPKGGAIIPRTTEAIAQAQATATEQLEKAKGKITVAELLSPAERLGEAIVYNLKTSDESREMLTRAWIEEKIERALNAELEGKPLSIQEKAKVQRYVQGL